MGINTLSKGRVKVGAVIGEAQVTAASIGSAELASGAVTMPKIAFGSWSTVSLSTGAATLSTGNQGVLLSSTNVQDGGVVTGTEISVPAAGQFMYFYADLVQTGSSGPLKIKSTAATFDSTGSKVISLSASEQFVAIQAASATRWVIVGRSTGVTLAGTT